MCKFEENCSPDTIVGYGTVSAERDKCIAVQVLSGFVPFALIHSMEARLDNLKHTTSYPCIDLNQVSESLAGWLAAAARLAAAVRRLALDFKFNHYNLAWHNSRAPNEIVEAPCHPHTDGDAASH